MPHRRANPRPVDGAIERNVTQFRTLSPRVPEAAQLGYHFCFGTLGGWPRFAPADLSATVDLANATIEASERRVDWIHIPVLPYVSPPPLEIADPILTAEYHHPMVKTEARLLPEAPKKENPAIAIAGPPKNQLGRDSYDRTR